MLLPLSTFRYIPLSLATCIGVDSLQSSSDWNGTIQLHHCLPDTDQSHQQLGKCLYCHEQHSQPIREDFFNFRLNASIRFRVNIALP